MRRGLVSRPGHVGQLAEDARRTRRVDQDPDLIARTEKLDELKGAKRTIEEQMAALDKTNFDLSQRKATQARTDDELRVFG